MKFGIFSDVHANLEALEAVLHFFKSAKVNGYFCCGDLVGYGPNPNECVDLVRKLPNLYICAGNHDRAATGIKNLEWFSNVAAQSIAWTAANISADNSYYLSELPKKAHFGLFTLVHGSPADPVDEYLLTKEQYSNSLSYIKTRFTIVGHTHLPIVFTQNGPEIIKGTRSISFERGAENIIINPGAVGQPRDSDPRASCAIFDLKHNVLEFERIVYDLAITQDKMHRNHLSPVLIERLALGQ